jgi:hypothetical protein
VSGAGAISISSAAVLSAGGKFAAASLRFLAGGNEEAVFNLPKSVAAVISGFAKTDTIDLVKFVESSASFANDVLTVNSAGGAAHLHFAGNYAISQFHFGSDGHGGTNITIV